jgi:outer membrane protein insertion porin family
MPKLIIRFYLLFTVTILFGCKMTEYPVNKSYAYKTKINIIGNYPEAEKKILLAKLEKQIDDSLITSRKRDTALGFIPYSVKVYHTFDNNNISRTKDFFKVAYLANGYFRGGVTTDTVTNYKKDTLQKVITFTVKPLPNHRIDTVILDLGDTTLQTMALSIQKNTILKKRDLYSQDSLDAERRRIASYFRNNGYLKFTKDDIRIIADTVNYALLKTTNDPIEQQELFEKAAAFNDTPTTSITILLKNSEDSARLKKYYIGNIIVHPDHIDEDTIAPYLERVDTNGITKVFFKNDFKNKVFSQNIFLKKGDLFKQDNYNKTIEAFNYLGPWQQVIINPIEKSLHGDTIDFHIYMLPFNQYSAERKVEGSYNQNNNSNNVFNNLLGINLTQSFKNRNLAREAIQTNGTAVFSAEFGRKSIISAIQTGINYSMNFPKYVFRIKKVQTKKNIKKATDWFNPFKNSTKPRSFVGVNGNYTRRFELLELADVGLNFGVQGIKKVKRGDWNWQFTMLNVENKVLGAFDSLNRLITANPNLAFIYNDGLIISQKVNAYKSKAPSANGNLSSTRLSAEVSGPVRGLFKGIDNNIFSFLKFEVDQKWNRVLGKESSLALRLYGGLGYNLYQNATQNQHLPFFRQFVAGGPNSMRAWSIRELNSYSTRTTSGESFGDIQAEVNVEYRHPIFKIVSIPVKGALFFDIGNIWNLTPYDKTLVPYNLSSFNRFKNDIAIGGGYGIRFDFDFFLLRFDLGLKIKDPIDINNKGGWFTRENFTDLNFKNLSPIQLQIGINYPF